MAKLFTIPPVPGAKDLFTLIEFLSDVPAYEAHLGALQDVLDKIQEHISRVGQADQIESLLNQAKERFGEADCMIAQAKLSSSALFAEAETKAEALLAAARATEKANADAAEKLAKQIKAFEENKAATEAMLQEQLQKAHEMEIDALKAKVDAEDLLAKYEAKMAKLKAATEE